MPNSVDKSRLPSRHITETHGSEGRKTMLYNLKTEGHPEGITEAEGPDFWAGRSRH